MHVREKAQLRWFGSLPVLVASSNSVPNTFPRVFRWICFRHFLQLGYTHWMTQTSFSGIHDIPSDGSFPWEFFLGAMFQSKETPDYNNMWRLWSPSGFVTLGFPKMKQTTEVTKVHVGWSNSVWKPLPLHFFDYWWLFTLGAKKSNTTTVLKRSHENWQTNDKLCNFISINRYQCL